METDFKKLNRSLHPRREDESIPAITQVYSYKNAVVKYIDLTKLGKAGEPWRYQCDRFRIYDNGKFICSHAPALDPYVSFKDNIVSMTSDGEVWIVDLDTHKRRKIRMSIVAFYHNIEENEEDPNTFIISGEGCYWGCEGDPVEFEMVIDKKTLKQVSYKEEFENDYDDEDDEEGE